MRPNSHGNVNIVQLAELSEWFHEVAIGHDHVVADKIGGPIQFIDVNFNVGPAAASRRNRRTTRRLCPSRAVVAVSQVPPFLRNARASIVGALIVCGGQERYLVSVTS